jgi:hypothetical protein
MLMTGATAGGLTIKSKSFVSLADRYNGQMPDHLLVDPLCVGIPEVALDRRIGGHSASLHRISLDQSQRPLWQIAAIGLPERMIAVVRVENLAFTEY